MSYSEKLQDPRWQKKRLEVFQRDSFCCSNCGNDKLQIEVHHLDYELGHEPWEYPVEFLKTLCRHCHEQERSFREKQERELLTAFKMAGFHVTTLTKLKTLLYFKSFSTYLEKLIIKTDNPNGEKI